MRLIIMLVTIALFMMLVAVVSAGAVFAAPTPPPQAVCGLARAEAHAPPQADEHIPNNRLVECMAPGG